MFTKILIANRGEIACRILRTAHRLGIQTVAVYSEVDRDALHVQQAQEAFFLSSPTASGSYLEGDTLIAIAKKTNAQAIHPGYGFLSENAEFARACEAAGLCFIGPSSELIATMGDKSQAKTLVKAAGLPVLPGYHGAAQDLDTLLEKAEEIGYPILLKACAGGGGKGMRFIHSADELKEALPIAQREAQASFGQGALLLEKYLNPVRHIEIQILADSYGNSVCLSDRECSIQRRHQKLIEEAPAACLSSATRQALQTAATTLVHKIRYQNAGTLEFLMDEGERFYFMEMNTRLQVEHPVTEMITGIDLVEWQIRISAGEALPWSQHNLTVQGHAIEARLCAEDPFTDFTPSTGTLTHLHFPSTQTATVRIDSAAYEGETISTFYDSLLAKIIVHADTRPLAIAAMQQALFTTGIVGVKTNLELLATLFQEQDFIQNTLSTDYLNQHSFLLKRKQEVPLELIALAAYAELQRIATEAEARAQQSQDPYSPWFSRDLWQLNAPKSMSFNGWVGQQCYEITASSKTQMLVNNHPYTLRILHTQGPLIEALLNDTQLKALVIATPPLWHLFSSGRYFQFSTDSPEIKDSPSCQGTQSLRAPLPGTVIEVFVHPSQSVYSGDLLLTVEAMKIEHKILAPKDGVIQKVFCQPGDFIEENFDLLEFKEI